MTAQPHHAPATVHVALSDAALDVTEIVRLVRRDDCGAIVTFEGTVRSPDRGRQIDQLEYEAFAERAIRQMTELAEQLVERYDVRAVAVVHRTGRVDPGGTAIVVTVSAPHRGDAFRAASELLDQVKERAAIWKKEHVATGSRWLEP